jgi:hypothetical protein
VTDLKHPGARRCSIDRVENIKLVIETLRTRELLRDELSALLKFSPSGTRKYIADLRGAGVMEIARYVDGTGTYLGQPVYCLVADTAHVDSFVANIEICARKPRNVTGAKSNIELAQRDASRHFHVMADDTYFAVKITRKLPERDQLTAALFGTPRARQDEQVSA